LKHGSLFSGIGGFDLAAEWMGWENKFHCEMNPFGQQVLKYYWPDAELFEDITKTDFTKYHGTIDIISGGFPCQPYSTAGKRLGKEDERHLWPEMLRAIREIQPRWVVGENVSGLISWNGGMVFDEVQADLEAAGYEVIPFVLPACGVNAPHRRDRVWFVAHLREQRCDNGSDNREERHIQTTGKREFQESESERHGREFRFSENGAVSSGITSYSKVNGCQTTTILNGRKEYKPNIRPGIRDTSNTNGNIGDASNPGNQGLQGGKIIGGITGGRHKQNQFAAGCVQPNWDEFPTQPPVCSRNDGLSPELVGITVSKHRTESIKGYGNAVVPQVVYQIFKAIQEYETITKTSGTGSESI
jgi:DNA (cytosine-5)-methyltransferase 1